MVVSKDAPQQHKQPSRKGKKAWRKNVDVTEVQEGLEIFQEEVIDGWANNIMSRKTLILIFLAAVSSQRNHQRPFLPSTQLARKPSRNPTEDYTSLSKPTRFLPSALQYLV